MYNLQITVEDKRKNYNQPSLQSLQKINIFLEGLISSIYINILLYLTAMKVDQQSQQQTDYSQLLRELKHNKSQMFRILEDSPRVGVYAGQSLQDWQIFFRFFMDFLRSQIGPRGQCAKKIRKKLISQEDYINKILDPFKLTAQTHIREIYMKCKNFVPCEQYVELIKIRETISKFQANLQKFRDQNSLMRLSIAEGLIKKHGADFDVDSQIKKLQQNYVKKIEQNQKIMNQLSEIVQKFQSYHQLMKAKEVLEPYFKQWTEADSMIGKQNVRTGQLFQEKVFNKILPYILHRQKSNKQWIHSDKQLLIFTNVNWIPKNLGEIDIALGYKDETLDTYFIVTLIQCKSRFFDLREAYMQVSLEDQPAINKGPTLAELKEIKKFKHKQSHAKKKPVLQQTQAQEINKIEKQTNLEANKQQIQPKQLGKKFLSTKYGPAELVENHHFYIITTLPQNNFILPIESKMKQSIQRHNRNLFIQDIQSESLYECLKERFEGICSPLDWISRYQSQWKNDEDSNIIVLR